MLVRMWKNWNPVHYIASGNVNQYSCCQEQDGSPSKNLIKTCHKI